MRTEVPVLQVAVDAAGDASLPANSAGAAVMATLEAFLQATGEFLMDCLLSARRGHLEAFYPYEE